VLPGIGFGEFAVVAIVLLVAVGPQRLPGLMKAVGQGVREFRRATAELRRASGIDEIMRDDPLGTRRRRPTPPPARRLPAAGAAASPGGATVPTGKPGSSVPVGAPTQAARPAPPGSPASDEASVGASPAAADPGAIDLLAEYPPEGVDVAHARARLAATAGRDDGAGAAPAAEGEDAAS